MTLLDFSHFVNFTVKSETIVDVLQSEWQFYLFMYSFLCLIITEYAIKSVFHLSFYYNFTHRHSLYGINPNDRAYFVNSLPNLVYWQKLYSGQEMASILGIMYNASYLITLPDELNYKWISWTIKKKYTCHLSYLYVY